MFWTAFSMVEQFQRQIGSFDMTTAEYVVVLQESWTLVRKGESSKTNTILWKFLAQERFDIDAGK